MPSKILVPSTHLESNTNVEEELKTTINDINSFNNSTNNQTQIVKYIKDENRKSKKRYLKYEILSTLLKTNDVFVIRAKTSNSVTLSHTSDALLAIAFSTDHDCGISLT